MAHILVVDDEVMIAMLFRSVIEAEGYRVTVAHDGIAALDAFERDPADALVTDLTMPRMGGRDLLIRLRERHPALPAIVVTGYAGAEDLNGRQTAVFNKPVSPKLLLQRLAELLADAETVRNF